MELSAPRCLAAIVVFTGLVSCGGGNEPALVTQTREAPASPRPETANATSQERLFGPQTVAPMGHGSVAPPQFNWTAPETWKAKAGSSMRLANFAIGDNGEAECYVTLLHGAGGGIEANVNRWRGQMGQTPLSADEIAALPKIEAVGRPSPFVEVSGTYTDMSGADRGGYLLYATIVDLAGESVFVKMTGPEALVRAEKDHFTAFCQSLKMKDKSS
jgi:hypothetical protein